MKRVVLITNIPTPYRIPLFDELADQLAREGWRLKVLFAASGYRHRRWEVDLSSCRFDHALLRSRRYEAGGQAENTRFTYDGLGRELRAFSPDVVIVLGFSMATVKVWLSSWLDRTPFIIWSGTIDGAGHAVWRRVQRKILAKRASAFVAYGSRAKEYLVNDLDARPDHVHIAINTVDTRFFAEEVDRHRRNGDAREDVPHLVFVGYLSPGKNVIRLLEAVKRLAVRRDDFILDIVGDGTHRAELEAFVHEHDLGQRVVFHGYRQKSEIPGFLARSRCFVFPSIYDVWGLVVVEAMAAALPVVSSVKSGVTRDLVRDGETGFALDFDDVDAVDACLTWMLDCPDEAAEMGRRARALVEEDVTISKSARGFVEAILSVVESPTTIAAIPQ